MSSDVDTRVYPRPSLLIDGHLALATEVREDAARPTFFQGFVRSPRTVAAGLLTLADIARVDYRLVGSGRLAGVGGRDPVVTCDGDRLRFEALSTCGGLYGRLDVLPPELDGLAAGRGTTNVDINPPLYEALARVDGDDALRLSVGADEVAFTTMADRVVEKRVPLPARWLRGLAEVAARAAPLDLRAELPAARAGALVAEVSAGSRRQTRWLLPVGRGWRSTAGPVRGAVCVADGFRLAVLRPLLPLARSVRLYAPPVSGAPAQVSGWELDFGTVRFTLLMSAAVRHGFAGEGQLLADLASTGHGPFGLDEAADDGDALAGMLADQPILENAVVAARTGWAPDRVAAGFAALATAGQIGYDLAAAAHFHRPLPYRADLVAALHPRLAGAQALAEAGRVRITPAGTEVVSGDRTYLVHRRGDGYACTCAWWARHRGERGPCKHVVAAGLVTAPTDAGVAAGTVGASGTGVDR